jgi:hypothetical protein
MILEMGWVWDRKVKHEYSGEANQQGEVWPRGPEAVRRFSKRDRDGIWVGGRAREVLT